MIPKRYAPLLFSLMLSGLMSLLITGLSIFRVSGPAPHFVQLWLSSWLTAWCVAFPVVLVVAPLTRKFVERLTAESSRRV